MRIAILTVHQAPSCGAMLQAWALKTVLQRMGHVVEFPDCNHVNCIGRVKPYHTDPALHGLKRLRSDWKNFLRNLGSRGIFGPAMAGYDGFRSKNLPERRTVPAEFSKYYDLVVVGSDQVWNEDIMKEDTALFLGETLPTGLRAISYAASIGDLKPSPEKLARIRRAMGRFESVGVREPSAVALLADVCRRAPKVTLDPTLLLEAEDYAAISADGHPGTPYLYCYSLFYSKEMWLRAKEVAARLGLELVYTPLHQYSRYRMPRGIVYGVTPDRFVDYIAHASAVITDSFHGTVVSLLHGKSFAAVSYAPDRRVSRQGMILGAVGAESRLFGPESGTDEIAARLSEPLPSSFAERLSSLRAEALDWLTAAADGKAIGC